VDKLHEVMLRIERFESGVFQAPADAEKLIVEIFQACGHAVSQKGFAESDDAASRNPVRTIANLIPLRCVGVWMRRFACQRASRFRFAFGDA
jgi:hypothetical protein